MPENAPRRTGLVAYMSPDFEEDTATQFIEFSKEPYVENCSGRITGLRRASLHAILSQPA
jgi:hypothetical protein